MKDLIVFTGDIVGSSRLTASELSAALDAIEGAAAVLRPALGETAFARNRGDGWQIAITEPRLQARLALLIRAKLRALGEAFSTRIAMAEGDGTLPADGNLNGASGAVFTASGQLLDSLEGPRIVHASGGPLGAALRLFDHLSESWTPAQARAVMPMLRPDPPTQTAAASEIGITRQSLAQALASAAYPAIVEALRLIENTR
ncbi:hypothetical protein BMG03_08720 [Thioclava nitratireducens]|uniref:MarR family transcriptional regulator n=1 Tax=Thioclava nitratireducens TaxID=1915078 RepID=A0ABM6IGK3_9RHOB|nr:hypothetical protein [Thioclava nitratireducens]AQS47879.1 hypothetical protein BMG03_08720 [Thioclava nitratireducens]